MVAGLGRDEPCTNSFSRHAGIAVPKIMLGIANYVPVYALNVNDRDTNRNADLPIYM